MQKHAKNCRQIAEKAANPACKDNKERVLAPCPPVCPPLLALLSRILPSLPLLLRILPLPAPVLSTLPFFCFLTFVSRETFFAQNQGFSARLLPETAPKRKSTSLKPQKWKQKTIRHKKEPQNAAKTQKSKERSEEKEKRRRATEKSSCGPCKTAQMT